MTAGIRGSKLMDELCMVTNFYLGNKAAPPPPASAARDGHRKERPRPALAGWGGMGRPRMLTHAREMWLVTVEDGMRWFGLRGAGKGRWHRRQCSLHSYRWTEPPLGQVCTLAEPLYVLLHAFVQPKFTPAPQASDPSPHPSVPLPSLLRSPRRPPATPVARRSTRRAGSRRRPTPSRSGSSSRTSGRSARGVRRSDAGRAPASSLGARRASRPSPDF